MPTTIVAGVDRAGIFSAVRHRRFRPLWTASILSGVAYVTALTARGWVAFDLHHHSSTVGFVVFASFLPSLIITPLAGVLADRYDRRTQIGDEQIGQLLSGAPAGEVAGFASVVAGSGGKSSEVARGFGSGVFATTLLPLHPAKGRSAVSAARAGLRSGACACLGLPGAVSWRTARVRNQ
jgi:MFS family permease